MNFNKDCSTTFINENNTNIIKNFLSAIKKSRHFLRFIEFEKNPIHKKMFEDDKNINMSHDIVHVLFILITRIKYSGNGCALCDLNHSPELWQKKFEQISSEISYNKKNFASYFNSFYQIPITQAQDLFYIIKLSTQTINGMYSFDLNLIIIDKISYYNNIKKTCKNLKYFGIFSPFDTSTDISVYGDEVYRWFETNNKLNACFIQTTGLYINEPAHFCAVYIDFEKMNYFFYNSLAKKEQLNLTLFEYLKKKYSKLKKMDLHFNVNQQQFDNSLCGIFSANFIFEMANTESKNRAEFFKDTFNIKKNLDKYSEKFQEKYLFVGDNDEYMFRNFLNKITF